MVDIEVIHYQVDGLRFRVLKGQLEDHPRELEAGTIRRGKGEMAARLGFPDQPNNFPDGPI